MSSLCLHQPFTYAALSLGLFDQVSLQCSRLIQPVAHIVRLACAIAKGFSLVTAFDRPTHNPSSQNQRQGFVKHSVKSLLCSSLFTDLLLNSQRLEDLSKANNRLFVKDKMPDVDFIRDFAISRKQDACFILGRSYAFAKLRPEGWAERHDAIIEPGHGLFFDFKAAPEFEKPVLDNLVKHFGWTLEKPFFIRKKAL